MTLGKGGNSSVTFPKKNLGKSLVFDDIFFHTRSVLELLIYVSRTAMQAININKGSAESPS